MSYYKCLVCGRYRPTPDFRGCGRAEQCGFPTRRWVEVSSEEGRGGHARERSSNRLMTMFALATFAVVVIAGYNYVPPFHNSVDIVWNFVAKR